MTQTILKRISPAILLLIISCSNSGETKTELDGIKQEYRVYTAMEDSYAADIVAFCKADFTNLKDGLHQELPEGYTLWLDETQLTFDNDENKREYATEKKVQEVIGNHTWRIKLKDKIVSEQKFTIKPFKLVDDLSQKTIGETDLVLTLECLADGDRVECEYENANAEIEDINTFYLVKNNKIMIPASDLQKLKPGSYKIWIAYAWDKPALQNGIETGTVVAYYSIEDPIPIIIKHRK